MGRAIDFENKLDVIEAKLKLVEDVLEEMIQTRVHHVDLHDDEVPAGKRKKTTKRKTVTVEKSNAEA